MSSAVDPNERILSTLNADGSRRWIKPRPSPGRWLNRRRVVGYGLIALFVTLPHLRINGKPPLLLDIANREFTLLGKTLYSTDIFLLAPLLITIFLSIFFLTALFGRVWCGWACPQTVYLELVYRPIERFFEGTPGKKTKNKSRGGAAVKFVIYLALSFALANTFLSYFVGTDALREWVIGNPLDHPLPFLLVVAVTGAMLFDFGYFREQLCIVACPYGRFQSVMLDRDSLVIGYDRTRGEPRGKKRRKAKGASGAVATSVPLTVGASDPGDCIDCHMCVTTCPTGIDIRDGLQLECINCAQCIDACDTVMAKIGRPLGLIRYDSQRKLEEGGRHWLRPRIFVYPVLIVALLTFIGVGIVTRDAALVRVVRGPGMPYTIMDDGSVINSVKVKIHNRTEAEATYHLTLLGVEGAQVVTQENPMVIGGGELRTEHTLFSVPRDQLTGGRADLILRVDDGAEFVKETPYRMLGPTGPAPAQPRSEGASDAG